MSSKVTSITSAQHFRSILSTSTYVVVDFYADWCGPCKVISPVFEQLAAQESKPGRLTFVKVNVDSQRDVASTYGISAMPTFLILRGTKTIETIRGANASALRTAILSVAADAARGPAASSVSFSGKGQTLGGPSDASTSGASRGGTALGGAGGLGTVINNLNANQLFSAPAAFAQGNGMLAAVVRFTGLYFATLFSFDPAASAEGSAFAVPRSGVRTR